MSVELPLFPLNTVLFPHVPMALHVFEARYRRLLKDCREQGTGFGVVGIAEGVEVGGLARPHRVGCLAQIVSVDSLEHGGANLLIRGASRFVIDSVSHRRPYLVGRVRWLEEEPGDPAMLARLSERVGRAFREYVGGLHNLASQPRQPLALVDDPEQLAYLISATLQIDMAEKQRLLEAESAAARLRRCHQLLRRELVFLDQMLAHQDHPLGTISPN
jgi:Lon protease-like protein